MAWYDENQSNQQVPEESTSGSPNPAPAPETTPDTAESQAEQNKPQETGWVSPTVEEKPASSEPTDRDTPPAPSYTPTSQYENPYGWSQNYMPQTPAPAPKPPKKKKGAMALVVTVGVACVGVIAALSVMLVSAFDKFHSAGDGASTDDNGTAQNTGVSGPTLEIADTDETAEMLSIKSAIQSNLDSTVSIVIYSRQTSSYYPGYGSSSDSELVEAGGATGIVMSKDGYIITNWHCVIDENTGEAYERIDVHMYDDTVYSDAKVIGADEDTDLAVIKVNATNLSPATFGDSSKVELGDTVIALGNAGGLGWTPTRGIISGSARDVYDDTGYSIKCLQTDAAINPGNSGGPLINMYGQVIGINSAKIVATGYESLGFSIPINEAKTIIDSLIKNGYVTGRVSLGITGTTVKLISYPGFQIASIDKDSDLKNTAAEVGDIITHVDGIRVEDHSQLRSQLTKHEVGDTVTLTLIRLSNRGVQTFDVKCKLIANKS